MKKQSKQLNIFIKSTAIMLIWAMLCSNIAYAAPVCNLAVPKVKDINISQKISSNLNDGLSANMSPELAKEFDAVVDKETLVKAIKNKQEYIDTIKRYIPEIITFSEYILDKLANRKENTKIIVLGRGAEAIYDTLDIVSRYDKKCNKFKKQIFIFDFSWRRIEEILYTQDIKDGKRIYMIREFINKQFLKWEITNRDKIVFVDELTGRLRNQTALKSICRALGFLDKNIDFFAGNTINSDSNWSLYLWQNYNSGREYNIIIRNGKVFYEYTKFDPIQRKLNRKIIFDAVKEYIILKGIDELYRQSLSAKNNNKLIEARELLQKAITGQGVPGNENRIIGYQEIINTAFKYSNITVNTAKKRISEIKKLFNEIRQEEAEIISKIDNNTMKDMPKELSIDFEIGSHTLNPFLTAMMGYCYSVKDKGSIDDQEFAEEIIKICNQIKNKFGKQDLYKHIENSLEAIHNKANIIIYQDELDLMTVSIPKKIEILVKRIDKICREECMEKISVKQKIEVPDVNMINPQLSLSHSLNNQV